MKKVIKETKNVKTLVQKQESKLVVKTAVKAGPDVLPGRP